VTRLAGKKKTKERREAGGRRPARREDARRKQGKRPTRREKMKQKSHTVAIRAFVIAHHDLSIWLIPIEIKQTN
jgi:hypothetical protein